MLNKIILLTKKFISIKSISDNPKKLEEILSLALKELKDFKIEEFKKNNSRSILVYNTNKRPKKFKIILNGHLDVIPGKDFQYSPKIKGNKLYGAGSMDMKANVACLIYVFKEMAEKVDYSLGLQLVTDEQIGGFNGTKYQIEKGIRSDFVIAAESTNFDIVNQAKGILLLRIGAKGKTAHGAYPWKGNNAIWEINNFLNKLNKKYPNPKKQKWVTTVNLSKIGTDNNSFNKIPDNCFLELDIRYVPKDKNTILKDIKKMLSNNLKLEIITNEPEMNTDKNNNYIKILQKSGKDVLNKNIILRGAQGTSDARHFSRIKNSGIEFGPIGDGSGSDKEWVDIKSLEIYYKILKNFLLNVKGK
jgi:succinyl-diaminopimelate desuccinylase